MISVTKFDVFELTLEQAPLETLWLLHEHELYDSFENVLGNGIKFAKNHLEKARERDLSSQLVLVDQLQKSLPGKLAGLFVEVFEQNINI